MLYDHKDSITLGTVVDEFQLDGVDLSEYCTFKKSYPFLYGTGYPDIVSKQFDKTGYTILKQLSKKFHLLITLQVTAFNCEILF